MIYQRTMKEANVICRMLGLSNAYAYLDYRNEHVPSSKGCWYFNVWCVGNEESLLKCRNYGFTKMYTVYCSWYTTAAVMCGRPNMTVRVQNTNTLNMGRVEVSMNGTWGKVAYSSGWTVQSANVVCRMLGLPNATAAPDLSMVYYKRPSGYTWIQIDGCKKNETSLFDCSFLVLGRSSYYNKHGDAGVICGPPKVSVSFAFNAALMGEVSLVVNTVRAKLGTKNWDDNSLAVLCRMAGVEGPHEVPALTLGSKVSQVEQFLWLNNVKCFGNESSLLDCENPGLRNKNKFGLASSSTAMAVCGRVNITFELTEGRTSRQGMVKPLFNGLQGVFYLRPEHNYTNLAKVICRTLGLPPPSLFVNDAKIISRYPQYRTLGIKDPRCYGNESSIGECKKTIVKDDNTGGLPGLICGKDFYCPSGCACSYALDSVHCTNANLTEVFQNIHMFTSTLHLQDNGSKTELDESFLLRLPLKVSTLSIKGYKIHRLKRVYFFRLKNKLDKLTLENNDLHILDPWFISRLKMSAIEIKDNNITTIKTDAFAGIFQCSSIYLTRNNIQFLERGAFATPYQLYVSLCNQ
ncbi:deleted in malignant brain tumors 1 protein-like [Actinia tenebrosa]|uniref:Deleted in malignant brain tumors 1 protein-like n=1 Tax=Actinia tenebrosa TaxID=6105 RepID=A0A6P8HYM5_ACTTE|nr:deleted in malignant brain tumors 1 protein-like [Actinia tenebrosa]